LVLKFEKGNMKVHFQEKNLISREKGSVDKIGFRGMIIVHDQCMMANYLGGGSK
jgi:hypothetical protein